ncbi:MAG: hypothetical protein E6F99_21385 [Actinobacteria bacterium]|nr:MAG: hypothetical protein E6F99_21385 [Actinomycetota bacterium]
MAEPTTRPGRFGSTAIDVSFCGAAAVSWLTVTSGGCTDPPPGSMRVTPSGPSTSGALVGSASSSRNADIRICNPAVPRTEATFPAKVLVS